MSNAVFFNANPVQLQIGGAYSTVIFSHANRMTQSLTVDGSGFLSGNITKVTCMNVAGERTDYFWDSTVSIDSGALIEARGPVNNIISLYVQGALKATATGTLVPKMNWAMPKPSETIFFKNNSVQIRIGGGYSLFVFAHANGLSTTVTAGNTAVLNGPIVKVTAMTQKGQRTEYFCESCVALPADAVVYADGPTNGRLTFKSTDSSITATAALPGSIQEQTDGPVSSSPSETVFFNRNRVRNVVGGNYSRVNFVLANGRTVTVPVGSAGVVDGPVVKITCSKNNGESMDYSWSAKVTFNSDVEISATGPVNNLLTLTSTDGCSVTAAAQDLARDSQSRKRASR